MKVRFLDVHVVRRSVYTRLAKTDVPAHDVV
jgi:hypothetical protein